MSLRIDQGDGRELSRLRQKLDSGIRGGPGVRIVNSPTGVTISVERRRQRSRITPQTLVSVRITSDGGYAGGIYNGTILQPPTASLDTESTVTADAFGTETDGTDCVVINSQEIGSSTHWITDAANTNQKTFLGRIVQYTDDGVPVVHVDALWAKVCS